jgi:hypothetical protein
MNVTKHFALAAAAMMLVLAGCPSEDEKVCSDFCGAGSACVGGQCVALSQDCDPACEANEACLMQDGTAACVEVCGDAQVWNAETNTCDLQIAMDHARYFNGFSDTELANGPAVTAECIKCHSIDAAQMAGSAHFKWLGPTTLVDGDAALGKKNNINNFCIGVASNEKRCTQCHAGYGDDTNWTTSGATYDYTGDLALQRVDCLICHADIKATGYGKITNNWGAAEMQTSATCSPACSGATPICVDPGTGPVCVAKDTPKMLKAAAKSVGTPDRLNCGFCHFYAGGADNVKMGDLGSPLKAPTMALDVHMGSTATGGQGLVCVDCHVTQQHRIFGAGVSIGVDEGRTACTDCHVAADHPAVLTFATDDPTKAAQTAKHLAAIACQTCHVPTFSRGRPTKMDWDWSTAGVKEASVGAIVYTMASGATVTLNTYDWMKGTFVWQPDVTPAYRWADGKGSHMTTADAFTAVGDDEDPIVLAAPTATSATVGAKISPFKEMKATQPALADKSHVLVPKLFGPGGFWFLGADGVSCTNPADVTPDKVPCNATAEQLQAVWNDVLARGAIAAGQLPAASTLADADWFWAKTRMYMNINHEVAPKATALGAGSSCTACHSNSSSIPFCELYGNSPPAGLWGVTCP